ncbi:Hypothetical predicted protein, partial [Pelobates cultripes]
MMPWDATEAQRLGLELKVQRTTSSSVSFKLEQEAGWKQSVRRNDCTGSQQQGNRTTRGNK